MLGALLKIQYTGASASCVLTASATGPTLSSAIGAAGAEVADAAFGTAGTIDLTGATVDTIEELAAVIDGYANYTASVLYGEGLDTSNILDAVVQAKTPAAYIAFDAPSILSAYSLVSWEYAKLMLDLSPDDRSKSEFILNATTAQGEHIAKRQLAARYVTKDLDGTGTPKLMLPVWPINSVSRVNIDSTGTFDSADDLDTDDYRIYSDEGYIALVSRTFPAGLQNVRVAWGGGFSPIPADLQFAAIECLKWNLLRLAGEAIGVRNVISSDGVNTGMEITIPTSARRVFESYRGGL
ncbi:MAG: hypothetical protein LLG08_10140 [Actinomycetia bacterium]|nr:hypothetical protein [Actinomycetes bacterium]